jgi:molybdenum cofactor cytidylyltransferase
MSEIKRLLSKGESKLLPMVLVLASGRGERFKASGGSVGKLEALLAGKPVLQHTMDAVAASGLPWHLEQANHPGMGDSIAAAIRANPGSNGWLILPADLPLVQSKTLLDVASSLRRHTTVRPTYKGQRGHPVGFGPTCKAALMQLSGNKGAAPVLLQFDPLELPVDDVGVVTDIDTVSDLQLAEAIITRRKVLNRPGSW